MEVTHCRCNYLHIYQAYTPCMQACVNSVSDIAKINDCKTFAYKTLWKYHKYFTALTGVRFINGQYTIEHQCWRSKHCTSHEPQQYYTYVEVDVLYRRLHRSSDKLFTIRKVRLHTRKCASRKQTSTGTNTALLNSQYTAHITEIYYFQNAANCFDMFS